MPDIRLALQILSLVKVPPRLEPELQLIIPGLLASAALPLRTGMPPDCREALIRVSVLLDVVGESPQSRMAREEKSHIAIRLRDCAPVDLMDAYLALGGVVKQHQAEAPQAAPPAPAAPADAAEPAGGAK